MSEVASSYRAVNTDPASVDRFEATVLEGMAGGEVYTIEDSRFGLVVAVSDYALKLKGHVYPQGIRFKGYNQATITPRGEVQESRITRYAIESIRNVDHKDIIDYAVELDPTEQQYWRRIDDVNGVSHQQIGSEGFLQVVLDGIDGAKQGGILVPVRGFAQRD